MKEEIEDSVREAIGEMLNGIATAKRLRDYTMEQAEINAFIGMLYEVIEQVEKEAKIGVLKELFKRSCGIDYDIAHKSDAGMISAIKIADLISELEGKK